MFATLFAGVIFGLALAAPPGPMNAIIAEESVLRGWLAGFKSGLGAATADFCFFLLALGGMVTVVERLPLLRAAMVGLGGLLMLYYAYGAYQGGSEAFVADGNLDEESKGFRKAFVLALTNPYQILFWLTVGVGLLEPGTVDALAYTPYVGSALAGMFVIETGSPVLITGLFGGVVVWILGFPATLVTAGRRVDRFAPVVAYASALVLAGFGVYFLADALRTLLG